MTNFSDRVRQGSSSVFEMVRRVPPVAAAFGQLLGSSLSTVADKTQAAFNRHFDAGYDPGASDNSPHRGEDGVALRNLAVRYGERYAFEGVSGEFQPGSLTAVVGPNGAGKSTLLKAIAGIVRPAAGEVICPALARHRLAYLPQQDELDRDFPITVAELVALGAWRIFGAVREPPPRVGESVLEALTAVGLVAAADRQIAELSVGQFQRALFARLILQDADVILLDEPFASLDESTTEDLLLCLRRWHGEGRTVIVVLHDLDCVRRHFPSTLLLAGSPIAWGETYSSLSADNLARAQKALVPVEAARMGRVA